MIVENGKKSKKVKVIELVGEEIEVIVLLLLFELEKKKKKKEKKVSLDSVEGFVEVENGYVGEFEVVKVLKKKRVKFFEDDGVVVKKI